MTAEYAANIYDHGEPFDNTEKSRKFSPLELVSGQDGPVTLGSSAVDAARRHIDNRRVLPPDGGKPEPTKTMGHTVPKISPEDYAKRIRAARGK